MRDCGVELRPIAQIAAATTLDFLVCRDDRGVQTRCVLFDGFALRGRAESFEALTLCAYAVMGDDLFHYGEYPVRQSELLPECEHCLSWQCVRSEVQGGIDLTGILRD